MARGRVLVIGYFTSRCCGGTVVGDLTVDWRPPAHGGGLRQMAVLDGVPILADERVADVLLVGRAEIGPGSIVRRGTPTLRLADPNTWMEFLERGLKRPGTATGS